MCIRALIYPSIFTLPDERRYPLVCERLTIQFSFIQACYKSFKLAFIDLDHNNIQVLALVAGYGKSGMQSKMLFLGI